MRTLVVAFVTVLTASASAEPVSDEPMYEIVDNVLKVPSPITFRVGSAELTPESEPGLAHVQGYLEAKAYISMLRVEVHSDDVGDPAESQALSERRALAATRALVARGVDCKRLIPVGFGPHKPIAPNDSAENRAKNRRVSFANAAIRGRPIGGMPIDGSGKVAGDPCR